MKQKGFTLIELLAVIVILGIILAIAIPGIAGIINDATKSSFQSDAKMVLQALNYKLMQDDTFDVTSVTEDNIGTTLNLSSGNYKDLVVTLVNNKPYVTIAGQGKWSGLTAYGQFDSMKVVNTSDYDITPPVITLVGSSPLTIETGSTYTDAGATASDNHDGNITSKIVVVNHVNTSTVGTYTVTYNVTDNSGNAATQVTRTVTVVDAAKPVITLNGSSTLIAFKGSTYTDAGATATDNVDGNITSRIVATGTVNTNTVGSYTINYNVSDNAGNAATTVTRTVNVMYQTYTFTNAGATGQSGPNQAQVNSTYTGTSLASAVTSSGGIQLWTVPVTATYQIEAWGAQGGNNSSYNGGKGAYIKGSVSLVSGDVLKILVGQQGGINTTGACDGGGGGGTYVVKQSGNTPLIIAGGGGGASNNGAGKDASTSNSGVAGDTNTTGGSSGNGGTASHSSGGGGLTGNGANSTSYSNRGGYSFTNGGAGGASDSSYAYGGFGGGAGGHGNCYTGGGGGGGYSGGGGGGYNGDARGGGGGSYNNGTNQTSNASVNAGHGKVIITILP